MQESCPFRKMQRDYTFNTFSDEEIRGIAEALQERDAVSETELREIINALQENTLCDTAEKVTENPAVSVEVNDINEPNTRSSMKFRKQFFSSEIHQDVLCAEDYACQESSPRMGIQTGHGFNTFSKGEVREIAQALRKRDSAERGNNVSEIELQEIINALHKTTLCDTAAKVTQGKNCSENPLVNIAIIGESGSGKSTFVNVIRGLDDDKKDGAAKTGVVETTTCPTAYQHPEYKNIFFWDHPGSGTLDFDLGSYLKMINIHKYNFFIIIASERVRQNDLELAKKLWSMGKKLFYVRNKIDSDLKASKLRRKRTFNEERILTDVRVNCIKNLTDCGIGLPSVYVVSCLELEKYDFHLLKRTLEKELKI
ncbi:interferon-inducible GTPase 1-like isoform X3 [Pyxicephalus adspersus]|uniref:interferon-inducible GTPase 1-like isoform X3 n=1 Tax=Pyxicephalus adspersus TaxID=30357 RepID=UPI003B5C0ACE